jgi:hypothetical protein
MVSNFRSNLAHSDNNVTGFHGYSLTSTDTTECECASTTDLQFVQLD